MSGSFRNLFQRLMIWFWVCWRHRRGVAVDSSERWSGISQVIVLVRSLPLAGAGLVGSNCCHNSPHTRELVAYCVW